MELWMEGTLCVLCVLGLCALAWVLLGRLLRPIPARNVRLVIADVDLTPQGWELALRLTTRWPGVVLWPVSALEEYICQVRN